MKYKVVFVQELVGRGEKKVEGIKRNTVESEIVASKETQVKFSKVPCNNWLSN